MSRAWPYLWFALAVFVAVNVVHATGPTEQLRYEVAANFTRACLWGDNNQVSAVTGSSVASTGLTAATVYRMICPYDAYFDQGASDSATSVDPTVKAGIELWFRVKTAGDKMNLRAVATTGTCDITECL